MSDNLQQGIYFRHGERPGPHWRLLLLNIASGTAPEDAKAAVASLWAMLARLRMGLVDDLNPAAPRVDDPVPVTVPSGDLTCLLGFGARLFSRSAHPLPLVRTARRPPFLRELETVGANRPFPSLHWLPLADRRQHDADLALQFIAGTTLAANRAIVECAKHITDHALPLQLVTFFDGFNREDRRSWIDFHDGVNTMSPEDRMKAIELIDDEDIAWMVGGTFLAFFRIEVNLNSWRALTREGQELLVGRDKLTGCPLISVESFNGTLQGTKMVGCPVSGTIPNPTPEAYLNPTRPADQAILLASHIHRANLNRGADPRERASNRVYRQGYEFLEVRLDGRLSLGLNFVSFQAHVERIIDTLSREDWLGDANFGGGSPGGPPDTPILALIAGGFYAVPPKGEPFPGATVFD